MDPNKKQEIIDDLETFSKSKDYYAKIGKAWKHGYLLYGPPGTGKSSMIAAMANFLKYDVYDLELTSVKDNTELRKLLIDTTGCILRKMRMRRIWCKKKRLLKVFFSNRLFRLLLLPFSSRSQEMMVNLVEINTTVICCHVDVGYLAIFYASVHAPKQVLVQTYPCSTSPASCSLCIWSFVQPPLEGLILDTIGGALAFLVSGVSPRTSVFFFLFATIKTVDDHCGLWLPGNLFHIFFKNNSAYHDIHHQLYGTKYNYSQPFFVTWDRILGTYMPYELERRPEGGFEAKPVKDCKEH
ncbi:hypothetical protein KY289_023293 [Solanum tuberosum]|nr:hypothetical protein KY289_023293 [Solanum tuberosum]